MAKAEDHLAIREELHEHLESLAELDALIESSQDETGELQQVKSIPCFIEKRSIPCQFTNATVGYIPTLKKMCWAQENVLVSWH